MNRQKGRKMAAVTERQREKREGEAAGGVNRDETEKRQG